MAVESSQIVSAVTVEDGLRWSKTEFVAQPLHMPIDLFGRPRWVTDNDWNQYTDWQQWLVWQLNRVGGEQASIRAVAAMGVRYNLSDRWIATQNTAAKLDKAIAALRLEIKPRHLRTARASLERIMRSLRRAGQDPPIHSKRRGPSGEVTRIVAQFTSPGTVTVGDHIIFSWPAVKPTTIAEFLATLDPPEEVKRQMPGNGDWKATWGARIRNTRKTAKRSKT